MADSNKFRLPARFGPDEDSVWEEYIKLAADHKPINLGQGFADFAPPEVVTNALEQLSNHGNVLLHQYTRGRGHQRLILALSALYSKLIGRTIDPYAEILVSAGAYEALYCVIQGHVHPGDEVVVIEPFFDCYEPMIVAAGGTPRFIPLRPNNKSPNADVTLSDDWVFDEKEMESLFNAKTKAIILNTPHNPLGKVFSEKELTFIANLCKKWDVMCISDEVYEWMVYKPYKHIRIATLPGMWEKTVTIGSAGKTFSVTGWKTGWAYGPANLMRNLHVVHQNSIYTCSTILQEAIAIGFETEIARLDDKENCYFYSLVKELEGKRDVMANMLKDGGLKPVIPQGGYFMVADWTPLEPLVDLSKETDKYKDYRFTKWMTKNIGLQGIPITAFYSIPHKQPAEKFVRYCFIKKDETLQKAAEVFKRLKSVVKLAR